MMKRMAWIVMAVMAVGLGGFAIHSNVVGQELRRLKESTVNATNKVVSGRVAKMLKNDHGDIDGFIFEDGESIHFPPHMGETVAELVKVGDRVEVRGREKTTPDRDVVLEAERIKKGGESIEIERPRPPRGHGPGHGPRRPQSEKPMNAKGTIREFVTNRHGDVDGLILSDGTEVKVPPHQGAELRKLAKVGAEVQVEGRRHETPRGDIHLHADRIIATSNGKAFERDEPHHGPHAPPHVEILQELREIRRLIEAQQKD